MRVCFLSRRFFPAISGMSVYALNFITELAAQGHDVTLISQYRGDEIGTRVYGGGPPPDVPGVRVIGLEALGEQAGGDFEADIATMVDTICAEHVRAPFGILHAQYAYPNGWAALLAAQRLGGLPVIISIQGGDGHWVGSCCATHAAAMERTLAAANALVIGGQSFVDEVSERLGTDPGRFTIIPGAVDTVRFTPRAGWTPGVANDPPRLLYHGRVDRRKGALDFCHALARITVPYAATISGIGPDLGATRALAAELGLTVGFPGYADYAAVPDIYRVHDVFVSPTYAEGFSNTVLEAMACGLPVLSCNSVGIVDCVRHDANGWLVPAGDVSAQANALERLMTDQTLRARLAGTALAEARAVYSWPAVTAQIAKLYDTWAGHRAEPVDTVLPVSPCQFRAEPHLL